MRGVVLISAAAAVATAQLTSCAWSTGGSTFDLSVMQSTTTYVVSDIRDPNSAYFFNFCGVTAAPTTNPTTACTAGHPVQNGQPALAWQVENVGDTQANDQCYRLGGNMTTGWNYTLFDPMYPAAGVVLTYGGGEGTWCPGRQTRSLSIALLCGKVAPSPSSYSQVTAIESNTCSYSVQLPSLAGCPTQCLASGTICNNNGVCGYNQDALRSQCYCYNGFSGPTCGDRIPPPPSVTVEGVLLIIVCIALAGVLGLVAYMVLRLRKLNVNPEAYGQLEGRFNELGQMA